MQVIKILQTGNSNCWSLRNLLGTTMKTYTHIKTQAASENCLFPTQKLYFASKKSISHSQWQHLKYANKKKKMSLASYSEYCSALQY